MCPDRENSDNRSTLTANGPEAGDLGPLSSTASQRLGFGGSERVVEKPRGWPLDNPRRWEIC